MGARYDTHPYQIGDGNYMKSYICIICGWVYDEEEGCPEDGIKPGTRWEDVPDDWVCPDCGAAKYDFEMEIV